MIRNFVGWARRTSRCVIGTIVPVFADPGLFADPVRTIGTIAPISLDPPATAVARCLNGTIVPVRSGS